MGVINISGEDDDASSCSSFSFFLNKGCENDWEHHYNRLWVEQRKNAIQVNRWICENEQHQRLISIISTNDDDDDDDWDARVESRDAPTTTIDSTFYDILDGEQRVQSNRTVDYDKNANNTFRILGNENPNYISPNAANQSSQPNTFESFMANLATRGILSFNKFTRVLCSSPFTQRNHRENDDIHNKQEQTSHQNEATTSNAEEGDHRGDDPISGAYTKKKKKRERFIPPTFVSFETKIFDIPSIDPPPTVSSRTLTSVSTDVLTIMIEEELGHDNLYDDRMIQSSNSVHDSDSEHEQIARSMSSISFDCEANNVDTNGDAKKFHSTIGTPTFETVSLNNEIKDCTQNVHNQETSSSNIIPLSTLEDAKRRSDKDDIIQIASEIGENLLSSNSRHTYNSVKSTYTKDSIDLSYDMELVNTKDSNISFDEFDLGKKTFFAFTDTLSIDGQSDDLLGGIQPNEASILKDLTDNTADDQDSETNSMISFER